MRQEADGGEAVTRGPESEGYAFHAPFEVAIISCPADASPTLVRGADGALRLDERSAERLKRKVFAILEVADAHGQEGLVLSALGCGAFHNPPDHVALLFREVFSQYFAARGARSGSIREVVFAIFDDHNVRCRCGHNPRGNLVPFQEAFSSEGDSVNRWRRTGSLVGFLSRARSLPLALSFSLWFSLPCTLARSLARSLVHSLTLARSLSLTLNILLTLALSLAVFGPPLPPISLSLSLCLSVSLSLCLSVPLYYPSLPLSTFRSRTHSPCLSLSSLFRLSVGSGRDTRRGGGRECIQTCRHHLKGGSFFGRRIRSLFVFNGYCRETKGARGLGITARSFCHCHARPVTVTQCTPVSLGPTGCHSARTERGEAGLP